MKQPTVADVPPVLKNMGKLGYGGWLVRWFIGSVSDVPGKVLSLEELEARMRKGDASVLNRSKQDEDMSAFKRLVSVVLLLSALILFFVFCLHCFMYETTASYPF